MNVVVVTHEARKVLLLLKFLNHLPKQLFQTAMISEDVEAPAKEVLTLFLDGGRNGE